MVNKWLANDHGCSGPPSQIVGSSLWTSQMEINFISVYGMLKDKTDEITIHVLLITQCSRSSDGELTVVRHSPL